jgi:hypothetical protein
VSSGHGRSFNRSGDPGLRPRVDCLPVLGITPTETPAGKQLFNILAARGILLTLGFIPICNCNVTLPRLLMKRGLLLVAFQICRVSAV